jgi:hypothetical protein
LVGPYQMQITDCGSRRRPVQCILCRYGQQVTSSMCQYRVTRTLLQTAGERYSFVLNVSKIQDLER